MQVKLLYCTPLHLIINGIRTCWKSNDKSDGLGPKDMELMKKIINFGHTSTLEHSLINYEINGVSRALLQETSRHRIGVSPSVESTRYTFKRILNGEQDIASTLVSSGDPDIDQANIEHMERIKSIVNSKGLRNDTAKYGIVEAYKTNLILSFNLRSLMHFYSLRNSKKALKEIRHLAIEMINILPEDYKQFIIGEE